MVRSDGHHRLPGRAHQPDEPAGAAKMGPAVHAADIAKEPSEKGESRASDLNEDA
jgi:hypothetical protein